MSDNLLSTFKNHIVTTNYSSAIVLLSVLFLTACGGGGGGGGDNSDTGTITGIDLAVNSLTAPGTVNAGDSITVGYNIRNNGDEAVIFFYTTVYLSLDATIISDVDTSMTGGGTNYLEAGGTMSVSKSITIPANLRSGSYYIGVKADSWEDIAEGNEANNVSLVSINVTGTSCTVDSYEQNDSYTVAGTIDLNTPQQHNHCDDDSDWFKFSALTGETYSVSTSSLGVKADTRVEVYDTDGSTSLAGDSNSGLEDRASRLSWTAPANGTYYIKVETPAGLGDTGADTEYSLTLGDASSDLGVIDASFNGDAWLYAGGSRWVFFYPFNNGYTSSGSFQVKAYMSTDTIIDTTDTLVGIYDVDDLAPGTMTSYLNVDVAAPKNTPPGTYYLGFIADADNVVAEVNEQNNLSNILQFEVVAVTACTLDIYEDDDFREFATSPIFGEVQQHNFCDDEKDWLMFSGVQGSSYVVQTRSQGGDANFSVYDPDDNYLGGGGEGSCCSSSGTFEFVAPSTGIYYLQVWSSMNNGGANSDYTVAVYDDLPDMTVNYLSYDFTTFYPGGVINIWPETLNSGFEDAGPSETGIYLSADAVLDVGDIYLGARANNGLAAHTSEVDWSLMTIPDTIAAGDYYLIGNADDTSQIMEIYEDNNTLAGSGLVTISPSACAEDAFEQDDLVQLAQPVSLGATQARNFCDDGHDWMKIDLLQGQSVVFQKNEFNAGNFQLYDTDQNTLLVGPKSNFLHWESTAAGTYYVESSGGYGAGTDYTLEVYGCDNDAYEDDNSRSIAPLIGIGESQARNLCDGTIDTVAFNAVSGTTYTISTSGLGINIDTEIELYDAVDAFFDIAWSDNRNGGTLESEISWTASADGTYYVIITGKGGRGTGTEYTITVQ